MAIEDPNTLPWAERARCRGVDPRLFFPERQELPLLGLAYCRTCPVREQCLAEALAEPELKGIWGGTTERERRRMRSAARSAVVTDAHSAPRRCVVARIR